MKQPKDEPYHVTLEVENRQCRGLRMLESSGVEKYALVDIRGAPRGPTRHLIKMPPEGFDRLPEKLFSNYTVGSDKVTSAWFNTDGCDVCGAILSNSSFLISARHIKGDTVVYNFVAPNFQAYRKIISTFESKDIKFKILEVGKFSPKSEVLTEKQERALWLALKMGFFEYPKRTNMSQLSKRLGVGPSSLSEMLRRGMRRLLEDHFES